MTDVSCPACSAPGLAFDGHANVACAYCGTQFVAESTECPACLTHNASGADLCSNCGEPLNIVASVLDRQGGLGQPLWIRRLKGQVADLKDSEARSSEQRFEELMEIDRRRKQAELEAYARQRQADRNIVFYGAAVILLIVAVVLVIVVLT